MHQKNNSGSSCSNDQVTKFPFPFQFLILPFCFYFTNKITETNFLVSMCFQQHLLNKDCSKVNNEKLFKNVNLLLMCIRKTTFILIFVYKH